jgi:hypothetical protein
VAISSKCRVRGRGGRLAVGRQGGGGAASIAGGRWVASGHGGEAVSKKGTTEPKARRHEAQSGRRKNARVVDSPYCVIVRAVAR